MKINNIILFPPFLNAPLYDVKDEFFCRATKNDLLIIANPNYTSK